MLNCNEKNLTASSNDGGPSTKGTSQKLQNVRAIKAQDGLLHSVVKNKTCNDQIYQNSFTVGLNATEDLRICTFHTTCPSSAIFHGNSPNLCMWLLYVLEYHSVLNTNIAGSNRKIFLTNVPLKMSDLLLQLTSRKPRLISLPLLSLLSNSCCPQLPQAFKIL